MTSKLPLPFDALRPFKDKLIAFTPKDNIPWEMYAPQTLRCRTDEGFFGLRPFKVVDNHIEWIINQLNLPPSAKILDIGCGPGMYTSRLAAYGYQVTGIDIAQPFLDCAQAEAKSQKLDCTYQNMSCLDMNFETEFDLVLFINSIISQLTVTELQKTLKKIQTALKSDGQLICEVSVATPVFLASQPTVDEHLSFLAKSPWSDQFHLWLRRELTFPTESERVTHHLLLLADGIPREYWSRFTMYPLQTWQTFIEQGRFKVNCLLDTDFNQPYQPDNKYCFIWAKKLPQLN